MNCGAERSSYTHFVRSGASSVPFTVIGFNEDDWPMISCVTCRSGYFQGLWICGAEMWPFVGIGADCLWYLHYEIRRWPEKRGTCHRLGLLLDKDVYDRSTNK